MQKFPDRCRNSILILHIMITYDLVTVKLIYLFLSFLCALFYLFKLLL